MKKQWTQEEDRNLLALKKKGATDHSISRILGRGVRGVSTRLYHLHAAEKALEPAPTERIGFLDIEASGLRSTFGICLSYCIADENEKVVCENVVSTSEMKRGTFDKRLMQDCVRDLKKFDRLITWNGARFDIPFVRTRCMSHNIEFPGYRELLHNDALLIARIKMRTLHSKRLGAVCEFLEIPAKDHPLVPAIWLRALAGNVPALEFILQHNREDVISLAKVWKRLRPHTRMPNTTI